jgi:hypothetical protein
MLNTDRWLPDDDGSYGKRRMRRKMSMRMSRKMSMRMRRSMRMRSRRMGRSRRMRRSRREGAGEKEKKMRRSRREGEENEKLTNILAILWIEVQNTLAMFWIC